MSSGPPVAIVADGPSAAALRERVIPRGVRVIAVNGAITWIPRADEYFTLDPDLRQRNLMRDPRPDVRYYAAVPPGYGTPNAGALAHRPPAERGVTFLHRICGRGPMGARYGMCRDPECISSGNSAWGALNRGCHIDPPGIGLFGVDGTRAKRMSGGHPRSLGHLPELFNSYDGDPVVVLGSPHSQITGFPKGRPDEVLEWLQSLA